MSVLRRLGAQCGRVGAIPVRGFGPSRIEVVRWSCDPSAPRLRGRSATNGRERAARRRGGPHARACRSGRFSPENSLRRREVRAEGSSRPRTCRPFASLRRGGRGPPIALERRRRAVNDPRRGRDERARARRLRRRPCRPRRPRGRPRGRAERIATFARRTNRRPRANAPRRCSSAPRGSMGWRSPGRTFRDVLWFPRGPSRARRPRRRRARAAPAAKRNGASRGASRARSRDVSPGHRTTRGAPATRCSWSFSS